MLGLCIATGGTVGTWVVRPIPSEMRTESSVSPEEVSVEQLTDSNLS